MTLVVLGTLLVLLVARETTRGALTPDRDHRAALTTAVVVPLAVCAAVVVTARLLDLGT
ncbi:hypothetical protein [Geodermatophilus dictyosporus]|nr:hypothetical protein [Geodermatophilus dictyosporus]